MTSLSLLVVCALAHPAHAQNADVAEELFRSGKTLLDERRYAEACPKFEESQRYDPASGTLLALAYCQELAGLLASAQRTYLGAADLADRSGHPDRKRVAEERAASLAPRLSTLTFKVPPEVANLPGLLIKRGDVAVDRSAFDAPQTIDGGTYLVQVSAPGYETWVTAVGVAAERDRQVVRVPVLVAARAPTALPPSPSGASSPRPVPEPPRDEDGGRSALRDASLGFAIVGLAGLGAGGILGVIAKGKYDRSNADGHCDARGCDPTGVELREEAVSTASAATITVVASSALLAGSVTLYLVSRGDRSSQPKVSAAWNGRDATLAIDGSF